MMDNSGTMSGGSKWSTPKYRSLNSTSVVDETLFGPDKTNNGTLRKVVRAPVPANSVVISAHELMRIKNESIIKSESEILADREAALREREAREKKARERIDRMKELEKRAASLAKKSDSEIAEIARKNAIREMAEKEIDQNLDVVKLLNSMGTRAVAYSIRDQQLDEKKRLAEIEKEFERRMDMSIEVDRLKDLKRREEEEIYRRQKRVEDRKVIDEQIIARQRDRLLQLEAREQENQAMRNLMKKYEEDDEKKLGRKRIENAKLREEVLSANEEAIRRKKDAKLREKKEVEDILIYQAMKDAELAKREEEEAAIERSKKERQAKLLAEQERVQSNAGKLDELRARRAAEEKERLARQREREEALKRKQDMKELLESRAKQAADKVSRQQQLKEQEKLEIYNQLQHTKKLDDREADEIRRKRDKVDEFRVSLQQQIEEIQRNRKLRGNGENGMTIREELLREEERLKVIRDQMVRDLEAQGVNPKYLSEMRNVDIGKILRR